MSSQALHPDFGTIPVHYSFSALPESSDGQVRATIHKIIALIRGDARYPAIQEEAQKLYPYGDGDPNVGLFRLAKHTLRFSKDEQLADRLPIDDARIPETVEVLIRPIDQWLLIQMKGLGIGDCDCFAMYGACLLYALGIPCSLCTVAVDPDQPDRYSHVYLVSYWQGVRTPLDLSHGEYPGWECPNLGRMKEWPVYVTPAEIMGEAALAIGALGLIYWGARLAARN